MHFKLPYAKRSDLSRQDIGKVIEAPSAFNVIDATVYYVGPIYLTILDSVGTVLQLEPRVARLVEISEELQVTGIQVIGRNRDWKY